jgi:hypothetical protein
VIVKGGSHKAERPAGCAFTRHPAIVHD